MPALLPGLLVPFSPTPPLPQVGDKVLHARRLLRPARVVSDRQHPRAVLGMPPATRLCG